LIFRWFVSRNTRLLVRVFVTHFQPFITI